MVSVDSWVAEDSEGGGEARRTDRVGAQLEEAPYAFDYPWPQLSRTAPVRFREVPAAALEELHREQSPEALPELCRQLVARLAGELEHPTDPLDPEPVVAFVRDMRDYFSSDGNAGLLSLIHI